MGVLLHFGLQGVKTIELKKIWSRIGVSSFYSYNYFRLYTFSIKVAFVINVNLFSSIALLIFFHIQVH